MLTQTDTEENPAAQVIPAIRPAARWRVAQVKVLENYRLDVRFNDGISGIVDMRELVSSPDAGVFAVLKDPLCFEQATVELGAVVWPCGLDLAPDAMYREIQKNGLWVL